MQLHCILLHRTLPLEGNYIKISTEGDDGTVLEIGSDYDTSDMINNPPVVYGPDGSEISGYWKMIAISTYYFNPDNYGQGWGYVFDNYTNPETYTWYNDR